MARPTRIVKIDVLRNLMEELLQAAGCKPKIAKTVADVFLEANIRGISTQGLHHLVKVMLPLLVQRRIDPDGVSTIVREMPATALIDGNRGPGQLSAIMASDVAADRAPKTGVYSAGVYNGADVFMIGYYAERIARRGQIGFFFTNSAPLVHVSGGADRMLGTNPFAVAIPTDGEDPILLDMATSNWSFSHVRHAMYHGEEIPPGVGVDADGVSTSDPRTVWEKGALSPVGGHKGYGLGLIVAMLCGPLTGSAVGAALHGWLPEYPNAPGPMGHFVIAIDPAAFGDVKKFRSAVGSYLNEIRGSRRAPGVEHILVPGERAFADRKQNLARGEVPVFEAIWKLAAERAHELGVKMPQ